MKYFLDNISAEQWKTNMDAYWKEFDRIKYRLSDSLQQVFTSKYLHDSEITCISFIRDTNIEKTVYHIIVDIKNDEFEGGFIHRNVSEFANSYHDHGEYRYLC